MDGLSLLLRAVGAGLGVEEDDGKMVVTGPVQSEALARELLAFKDAVLGAVRSGIGLVFASWNEDARHHYIERLGVALDLEMDFSPCSGAEQTARREAARVAAGVPASCPAPREGDLIDAALSVFAGIGGLRFGGFLCDAAPLPDRSATTWESQRVMRANHGGNQVEAGTMWHPLARWA